MSCSGWRSGYRSGCRLLGHDFCTGAGNEFVHLGLGGDEDVDFVTDFGLVAYDTVTADEVLDAGVKIERRPTVVPKTVAEGGFLDWITMLFDDIEDLDGDCGEFIATKA